MRNPPDGRPGKAYEAQRRKSVGSSPMPGAYRNRIYGRFSDLPRRQASSHRSAKVTFAWGVVGLTAAGTVQDFHLLPSQG